MQDVFTLLVIFGGVSGIIAAAGWANAERIRARGRSARIGVDETAAPSLAELTALKQQISEMQDTSHQFDLSFDDALTRLEQRVVRIETKTAVSTASIGETTTLRNGQNS